jgi:hypothetical protein
MAGKKDKKSAKDTGKAPSLLPKSIAGMKLPKEARRQLTDLAKHPVVADLIAAGLVALAARIKGEFESATKAEPAPAAPSPAAPPAAEPPAAPAAAPAAAKRVRKPAAAIDETTPAPKPPVRRTRKPATPATRARPKPGS